MERLAGRRRDLSGLVQGQVALVCSVMDMAGIASSHAADSVLWSYDVSEASVIETVSVRRVGGCWRGMMIWIGTTRSGTALVLYMHMSKDNMCIVVGRKIVILLTCDDCGV